MVLTQAGCGISNVAKLNVFLSKILDSGWISTRSGRRDQLNHQQIADIRVSLLQIFETNRLWDQWITKKEIVQQGLSILLIDNSSYKII